VLSASWSVAMSPAVIDRPKIIGIDSGVAVRTLEHVESAQLHRGAYLPDRLAWLAPVLALIRLAAASIICRRCSSSTRWSATHTAALVAGALPAHSLLGLIAIPLVTLDRVLLAAIMVGEVAFGI
jgi:hypothetical protein